MKRKFWLSVIVVLILAISLACSGNGGVRSNRASGTSIPGFTSADATAAAAAQEFHVQLTLIATMDATPTP